MRLALRVNGQAHAREVETRLTLADFLRDELGLTGTHVGCEDGFCGACTVLLDGQPVCSCLLYAIQAEGADVRTVEDLAAPDGSLHSLQEAFRRHHALQCGFCTPGMLITALAFVRERAADTGVPTDAEVREAIAGNLCRCTGYQGIIDAIRDAARATEASAGRED